MTTQDLVELVVTYRDGSGGDTSVTALCVHVWNAALEQAALNVLAFDHDVDGGVLGAKCAVAVVRELRID